MDVTKNFGKRIKYLRESKGWSQEDLAEISGLHRTYISGIERGIRNPTLEILLQLSESFELPLSKLLENVESS